MSTHTIALLPGDGVGPEVVAEARRAIEAACESSGASIAFEEALIGGAAIDATGVPLPDETVALCRRADAVLLGAVGGPKWDDPSAKVRPEQGLLGIRRTLGLFANLRPVHPHPALADASPLRPERIANVDLLVVRELTGGIYFGEKRLEGPAGAERASDLCVYDTAEIERVVRMAGELARGRRGHVTSVDKANVLETSRLWRRVTTRVMAEEFPDVRLEHVLVDSCAMHLVLRPAHFDVIVTENMFGDILTDEAAVLAGSIGLLPSASLGAPAADGGARVGLYEPIHGSAPDIAGRGIANPVGTILSAAMLLRHSLGMPAEAAALERAASEAIAGGTRTADLGGSASTRDMADAVLARLAAAPVA
ncbi:MAG: 3-isopropylmalate dehydrogenase [Gemmatirosa sp.]|nr:3-isopropylmalate dehydrogenase [Gemmatirosa sp.]